MTPAQIFELIVKADDAIKYATSARTGARVEQARRYLLQARQEAEAIGNLQLVELADQRLADLESLA